MDVEIILRDLVEVVLRRHPDRQRPVVPGGGDAFFQRLEESGCPGLSPRLHLRTAIATDMPRPTLRIVEPESDATAQQLDNAFERSVVIVVDGDVAVAGPAGNVFRAVDGGRDGIRILSAIQRRNGNGGCGKAGSGHPSQGAPVQARRFIRNGHNPVWSCRGRPHNPPRGTPACCRRRAA